MTIQQFAVRAAKEILVATNRHSSNIWKYYLILGENWLSHSPQICGSNDNLGKVLLTSAKLILPDPVVSLLLKASRSLLKSEDKSLEL